MMASSTSVADNLPSRNISPTKLFALVKGREGPHRNKPGTSYFATFLHYLKGSIGTGIFAMGYAMSNVGLVVGPIGLTFLGFMNLYCQQQLIRCADIVASNHNYNVKPDYAETVMVGFMDGPEITRKWCFFMKRIVNAMLVITQMGFCCVYVVFMADSLQKLLGIYGIHGFSTRILMLCTFPPIWVMSMLNNLKVLVPASIVANILNMSGLIIVLYYNVIDVPDLSRLPMMVDFMRWPLFFGTAIFSFESIGLVLPMYNEMKKPKQFNAWYGVLNVGMTTIVALNVLIGFTSYMKWGTGVAPSVTLNLPAESEILAQAVVILIACSVAVTYLLQLYVAFMILFPFVYKKFGPFTYHYWVEVLFKTFLSVIIYVLAETIPYLGEFISLVGAVGGTSLALVFPPVLEIVTFYQTIGCLSITKNVIIILVGVIGIILGTFVAVKEIVTKLMNDF